ncbi:penicillin acylase family protein [Kitasatospora sp. NPDC049285]|uniref:penicillin acylase family protein n=1 Tax=Kitasatospora sp. NPDC049285 TaxID=3157096 RepID=UPI003425AFBA
MTVDQPGEVRRDAWGVPWLTAADPLELARLQGRNAAEDRTWQLHVERLRAEGRSAELLGAGELEWDVFARRARLADTARRCHAALDAATAAWVAAYVDGVNSGLAHASSPQFGQARPEPWEPWTPLALWLSHHILFAGFPGKLWRARVARHLGVEHAEAFATEGPAASGSNGWLIAGERTATGQPLIAGDPHRFVEDPGIYQQVRLSCPEFDVLGLAVPGVPGIAHFGHTGEVAWAITNAMADYQDLYRERLRRTPDGRLQALGPDGWADAAEHTETVHVLDGPPVRVRVVETARGPLIAGGPDSAAEALSLRYPPRVTGELGFAALPALLRARTVAELAAALERWAEPVNVVLAADTRGGLLHRVAGAVPLRPRANSVQPVPAWEPAYAWRGWAEPPRAEVRGTAVMANQRGLAAPLGIEFSAPHRAERIAALLDSRPVWDAERQAEIHTDTWLGSAGPVLELLATLDGLSPAAEQLRARLLHWDRRMAADSVDAAAYAALRTALVRELAQRPVLAGLAAAHPYPALFTPWLALLPRIGYALDALIAEDALGLDPAGALRAALERTADRPPTGTWGEHHRLAPWQARPGTPDADWPGLAGDHDCVLATSSVPGVTDRSARGPAARYVWDLADRANSRWVVPFGAAGNPEDPHHRDQLTHWLAGALLPVPSEETP